MRVNNKKIIVTGGGNGLGRALTMELLRRGAGVIAVDINPAALEETSRQANGFQERLFTEVLDITDRDQVEKFAKQVVTTHGSIDGLINNAGIIQPFVQVNDLDYKTIDRVFNVDFFGTLYMTKAFLDHFLQRPEAHLINVASMGGLFPVPGQSIYGAAKSAVKLLTEGLQAELHPTGVRVTLICPGGIETDIKFNSGTTTERKSATEASQSSLKLLKPAQAARLIIDVMENNQHKVLIGTDIKLLNFIHRLSPRLAGRLIRNQMKSHLPD